MDSEKYASHAMEQIVKAMKRLLIIFYRNPEMGKVKSRLAITVGEERALAIYLLMAAHARSISSLVAADRVVYYSAFIDTEDNWSNDFFMKRLQSGSDLGERMKQAFKESFEAGYDSICIIGTDCLEITAAIVQQAFDVLNGHDAVIGPAVDGGYYLLGMKRFIPQLFDHKQWSTETVCADTMNDFLQMNISFDLLPKLRDVDSEADLPDYLR
jgi:rSAM/selenodomain-associated transferase 1